MAAIVAGVGKVAAKVSNDANSFIVQWTLAAHSAADTIEAQIPDTLDKDFVPLCATVWERAITGVVTSRPVTITAHQVTPNAGQTAPKGIGVTILTVGASPIAAGAVLEVHYTAVKFGLTP